MNRIKEQEIFFNYIKNIYLSNPNLQINEDTIYKELMLFYENNGTRERINENGLLLNVQQKLGKKFGLNFDRSGYFWFFENRGNLKDKEFYDALYTQRTYELITQILPEKDIVFRVIQLTSPKEITMKDIEEKFGGPVKIVE